ncbi:MAG: LCP family protein [Coriobacteriia bacterium]|nr:LCP family protein [Coriobacteriia bacterium]
MIVSLSVLALLLVGAGGVWVYMKRIESTMQQGMAVQQKEIDAQLTAATPTEPFNVLLLGTDGRKGETSYRSDTVMLAHIDPVAKKVWIVSIPRDTKVAIPGHGQDKINAAHTYGGAALTIQTVKEFTGLPINYYMEVNFEAFQKAVDALGGVWVDVPVAINDSEADGTTNKTASKVAAGYQLLDGAHALTFVRARHQFVDQDFARMRNQQLFLKALADQMTKAQNISKIPSIVSAVAPYVTTNMSLVDMVKTAQALKSAGSQNVYTATVTGSWSSPYIIPDLTVLNKLMGDIKAGRSFDSTSTSTAGASTTAAPAKQPADVSVTVLNGAGIAGVAGQASAILRAQGFPIASVGNASQNVYTQTLVIYKTDSSLAALVASYLQPGTKLVESRGMYTFSSDVLVVVGKDWNLSKVPTVPVNTN